MKSPTFGRGHLDRYLDCTVAIRPSVSDIFERAVAAGWTHNEVATALVNLAADLFPGHDRSPAEETMRARVSH